jgi:prepilin-type processing-associated H-X9-DG protein
VADRNFDNNGEPPLVTGVAAAGDFAAVAGARLTYASSGGSCDPLLAGPIHTTSRVRLAQVTDGASRTLAVGERHLPPVDPAWPADLVHLHRGDTAFFSADTPTTLFREPTDGLGLGADDRAVDKFGGPHPGVTQFVFLDGHVDSRSMSTARCCGGCARSATATTPPPPRRAAPARDSEPPGDPGARPSGGPAAPAARSPAPGRCTGRDEKRRHFSPQRGEYAGRIPLA